MNTNIVDRALLQKYLEEDLNRRLADRVSMGPIPDFDVEVFRINAQIRDLNRKSEDSGVTDEQKASALSLFEEIQHDLSVLDIPTCNVAKRARDLLHIWLPPLSSVEEEIWGCCDFGPGTVFHARTPSERSTLLKIAGSQTVTPKALTLAVNVIGPMGRLGRLMKKPQVVPGNRIAYVPKDVSKCRLIAVEPSINVFLQKGIGNWLVKHLRMMGIADLVFGQERHRQMVKQPQKWGTIDLSSASDRISEEVVRYLLPPDWFELLDTTRSHYYLNKGKWVRYTSFSSQGNAFTFPLETMIFKAISLACSAGGVSVYGDDIIASIEDCPAIAFYLKRFGFVVNKDKSFWGQHDGDLANFRESCGADTFKGRDVRPVFFRSPAVHESDICALMNRLYESWGFLPTTHNYLMGLREVLIGPRVVVSDKKGTSMNIPSTDYSAYLWDEVAEELGYPSPQWTWCPQYQTLIRKVKFYSSSVVDLPPRYKADDLHEAAISAFIRSGSPYASPLSKPKTRLRVVSMGGSVI